MRQFLPIQSMTVGGISTKLTAVIALTLLLSISGVHAQNLGISSTGATPNASAVLDLSATNKGLLIPRIALTATNVASPVTSPAVSLLIYNTATTGPTPETLVSPGYYYWNGSIWVRLAAPSALLAVPSLTTAQLRGGVAGDAEAVILIESGREGLFVYNPTSTAADDSALVIKAGTKAFHRVYDGTVKPEWYGAKGDGITNDSDAFQKSLRNSRVQADRNYRITENLTLPKGGSLSGKGTINFAFTSLKNGLVMADHSSLDGLTINMNSSVGGGSGQNNVSILIGKKIRSEFVTHVMISNVTVSNNKPDGVRILILGGSNHIQLDNITLNGNGVDGRGIQIEWGMIDDTPEEGIVFPHNIVVENVVATNFGGSSSISTNDIIFLSGVYDVTLRNIFTDTSAYASVFIFPGDYGPYYSTEEEKTKANTGIVLDNITALNCNRHGLAVSGLAAFAPGAPTYSIPMICRNSYFRNKGGGIVGGLIFSNVTACLIESSIVSGFYINTFCQNNSQNITFRDVIHRNSLWHGAYIHDNSSPPEDIKYLNCLFENTGTGTPAGAGILVGNARRPTISNCMFGAIGTEVMRYGIQISSQANPVAADLVDNYVRNVLSGGIGTALEHPQIPVLFIKCLEIGQLQELPSEMDQPQL